MTTIENLPQLPFKQANVLDVPPTLRQVQQQAPITKVRTATGDQAWLVTGHAEARALFTDDRLGHSHPDPENAARISNAAFLGGPSGNYETEKTDHTRMRRLLAPAFSTRRMRALSTRVDELVADLLNDIEKLTPPADLHEALSYPLPALVICELLGVPYQDHELFRGWCEGAANLADAQASATALGELTAYMHQLIDRKRRDPGEDVISDLAAASDQDQIDADGIAHLATVLLFVGHKTTVTRIDSGTILLLAHPAQLRALIQDHTLMEGAVEEILRMSNPGSGKLPRYAHSDITISGVTIRTGDAVLLATQAANRDPRVFSEPDRFDITRAPNPHLTFAYGTYFCPGASLSRIELRAVFGALFRRFPTLSLAAPMEQLRLRGHLLAGGLVELPVTW